LRVALLVIGVDSGSGSGFTSPAGSGFVPGDLGANDHRVGGEAANPTHQRKRLPKEPLSMMLEDQIIQA
jgi:hypothetical protein